MVYTTHKNGGDWGMVYDIALTTLFNFHISSSQKLDVFYRALPKKIATPGVSRIDRAGRFCHSRGNFVLGNLSRLKPIR
jgi:hypothetical protein